MDANVENKCEVEYRWVFVMEMEFFYPDNGGTRLFRNVGALLSDCTPVDASVENKCEVKYRWVFVMEMECFYCELMCII